MIERARELMSLGLSIIPVPYKQKGPIIPNWQHVRVTDSNFDKYFSSRKQTNVGVLLGEPSGNLVDIDLDCPEAIELAAQFLPQRARCFGRKSKRKSHWVYRTTEALPSKQFYDPDTGEMLLEFRSTGLQTVFPGSVHASGEPIDWESQNEFAVVDGADLFSAAGNLANAILIGRGQQARDWSAVPVCEPEPSLPPDDLPTLAKRKARARKYALKTPGAISGQGGHAKTFILAQALRRGFGLPEEDALELMREYNERCEPRWKEHELRYKLDSAARCGRMSWYSMCLSEVTASPEAGTREPAPDWIQNLVRKSAEELAGTARNATAYLINHEDWKGCLAYDEFHDQIFWAKSPPPIAGSPAIEPGPLHDDHTSYIQQWFWGHGIKLEKTAAQDSIGPAAKANTVNPLKAYFDGLQWDKVPRLARWLTTYLDCPDNEYTRKVGVWFMIGAAERAISPGSKMDYMLILEGPQGAKKSTAIRVLGGEFYLEGLPDVLDKDAADALNGHWITEVDELEALRRTNYNKFKQFLTRREDTYRPSYGRSKVKHKRTCAFIGSTNEFEYLSDPTGARRFWPVRVGKINIPALQRDRDQLWAEALHMHERGDERCPSDKEVDLLMQEQEARHQQDPWDVKILQWVSDKEFVSADDVLTLGLMLSYGQINSRERMRVSNCLRKHGWVNERRRVGTLQIRGFIRKPI